MPITFWDQSNHIDPVKPHDPSLFLTGLQVLPYQDDGLQEALGRLHRQHEARPAQGWHEGTNNDFFKTENNLKILFIFFGKLFLILNRLFSHALRMDTPGST